MAATIKDLARVTGLGVATISKYLNGGRVRARNEVKIREAVAALDYRPNEFARSLKTHRSRSVGIVIPELASLFTMSVITAMEEELRKQGYAILVCDSRTDPEREADAVRFLLGKQVDALALMPAVGGEGVRELQESSIPLLILDRRVEKVPQADQVLTDNVRATREATELMLRQGHRQIGIILGPEQVYTAQKRAEGYRMALNQAKIPVCESWLRFTDYTVEGGYEAMRQLLADRTITGIVASNGETTLGAILALREAGLTPGKDLAFVGFDNRELARAMEPKLTIMVQPVEEIGRHAARLLLSRMENPERDPEELLLPMTLELGESVGRGIS